MFTISCPPKVIWLGRKGENEFRTIEVEVSEWLRDYPNGTISVVYHRPDGAIYLPAVATSGNITSWIVTATDTAIAGKGEVEYRIIDGDIIGKSVKMPTMVSAAINATTDSPDPPPEDWTAVAAEILGMIGDLDNLDTEAKNNLVAAINEAFNSGGGGGTNDHRQLTNRDAANQHPMSAITGLQTALNGKQPSGDYATSGELDALADIVDGKADAADIPSLDGYATESYVQNYHDNTKQDVITDLASIRSGAALGATSVQPDEDGNIVLEDAGVELKTNAKGVKLTGSNPDGTPFLILKDVDNPDEPVVIVGVAEPQMRNEAVNKGYVDDNYAKKSDLGELADLDTTDKSSIVAAINEVKQQGSGSGWTTAQINLLEAVFAKLVYTDAEGGAIAAELVASLRGETPSEYDISFADGILAIRKAPATQSGSTLTIV